MVSYPTCTTVFQYPILPVFLYPGILSYLYSWILVSYPTCTPVSSSPKPPISSRIAWLSDLSEITSSTVWFSRITEPNSAWWVLRLWWDCPRCWDCSCCCWDCSGCWSCCWDCSRCCWDCSGCWDCFPRASSFKRSKVFVTCDTGISERAWN